LPGVSELIRREIFKLVLKQEKNDEAAALKKIHERFLFTLVGALILRRDTVLFACGDGEIHLNGKRIGLPAPPRDAPSYLTHALLSPEVTLLGSANLTAYSWLETATINSLVIGTDGLGLWHTQQGKSQDESAGLPPVPAFQTLWQDDIWFSRPEALGFFLQGFTLHPEAIRHVSQLLVHDDMTVCVIRRHALPATPTIPSPPPTT
jgi:hypothetical protein